MRILNTRDLIKNENIKHPTMWHTYNILTFKADYS